MASLKIPNRDARRLWLHQNGLGDTPTGALDLPRMINQLGFVQLDSIQIVARAHHHILWSRNQNYREPMLNKLLSKERGIFEHFTHDASVLPMEFLPMWQRQFTRKTDEIRRKGWYKSMLDEEGRAAIRQRIQTEGALSTSAFDTKIAGKKEMWTRPPHKLALDYMWFAGELAACHRVNFQKYYNLPERVFPDHLREVQMMESDQVDWLCDAALARLGFGTVNEIKNFWDAMDLVETRDWVSSQRDLVPVEIQSSDGSWTEAVAQPDIETHLANLGPPTSRLRILNPFDPAIRDRVRLNRLFGFDYRVEMFVPAAQRIWGYYVFPILEGDRFVGRIEVKADRKASTLNVLNFWQEPRVVWSAKRHQKLDAELHRMARFVGVTKIINATSQTG